MPRKRNPWFRFYVEAVHDRKLRRQDPAVRWLWVALLAIARESPIPGTLLIADTGDDSDPASPADIADIAALPAETVRDGLAEFERLGMVDRHDDAWRIVKWGDRQFESDDVTKRTRKHRSNADRRNVPTTFPGTPPETETETETERSREMSPRGDAAPPDDHAFDEFWTTYPRHHSSGKPGGGASKAQTRKKWQRLTAAQQVRALTGVHHYAAWINTDPNADYPAAALTWLNQHRYDDWQQPAEPPANLRHLPRNVREAAAYDQQLAQAAEMLRNGTGPNAPTRRAVEGGAP